MDTAQETRHDRQQRLQARNDRNALITAVFGVMVVLLGLFVGALSPDVPSLGGAIMVIGVVPIIAGWFYRGRPVR